jgi:hypothetical protein
MHLCVDVYVMVQRGDEMPSTFSELSKNALYQQMTLVWLA